MRIIKILSIIFLILVIAIFYLSIFGIKTDKFNNQIINNILKNNKKINLKLSDVNYLLNPYNFTVNIKTKNPQILLNNRKLAIKDITTNVSLKSLINDQFSIDDLKITTKEIKLNDVIALIRVFRNSPQLFVINAAVKDGFVSAKINLNFDNSGKVKENYEISGSIKKAKLNFFNQFKVQNLNLYFDISKNNYSLNNIDVKLNDIKIISPIIEIKKKNDLFFINGKFLNDKKNFDIKELEPYFSNLLNNIDLKKLEFSSINDFSFNINKKLKFNDFKVETIINLDQLIFNEKNLKLKRFFPSFVEEVKLEKHKIEINYNKNKLDIKGNGNFLLEDKSDNLSYQMIKKGNNFLFDSKINLKNNSLLIDFLDYEKKAGLSSLVSIKGNFKKNNQFRFDLISLKEKIMKFQSKV